MFLDTFRLLIPEIVLVCVATLIYVAGAFVEARKLWSWIAGGGIIVAAVALLGQTPTSAVEVPLAGDALAYFARWLAVVVGGLFVLLASRPLSGPVGTSWDMAPQSDGTSEYVGSLLMVVAGLMLAAGANELILLFVGLELISIPTYLLLYLGRRDAACQESALKYFFLSILASAMLLYGFAFLYGVAGSTELPAIRAALAGGAGAGTGLEVLALVALVLVFAGLSFKVAAVPFHFYAPDVYQGTTQTNAALLSVVPKAAGLVVLVRILVTTLAPPGEAHMYAWRIALALSVLTMTLGNVLALWQANLRRLLAYSSIAHAGYMLIGLAVAVVPAGASGNWDGSGALLFYLAAYIVATIGTFAALDYLGRDDHQLDNVDELAGLGRTRPLTAAAIAVFMFSLAGIPPLAGFWGKLAVFGSALSVDSALPGGGPLRHWFIWLAVIGVMNAAVAAAYYLRIVSVMYFRTPLATPKAEGGPGPAAAVVACTVLTILIGLHPSPLAQQANHASPAATAGEQAPPPVVARPKASGDPSHNHTAAAAAVAAWHNSYSRNAPTFRNAPALRAGVKAAETGMLRIPSPHAVRRLLGKRCTPPNTRLRAVDPGTG